MQSTSASLSTTPKLNQEYLDIIASLDGAQQDRRDTWQRMNESTAIYNDIVVFSGFIPKLFDTTCLKRMANIASTTYGIIEKVIRHYVQDPAYRKLFSFDPRLERLMLLPQRYDSLLPIARIDLFLNEETLEATFCEFNADGSSGMNENREVYNSIKPTTCYRTFGQHHSLHDCNEMMFEGWVEEFLRIYATYSKAVEHPHVAIVDYLDHSVLEEFKIYANLFEQAGCTCSIYDIRELTYENGQLIGHNPYQGADNAVIDVAWRRAVPKDLLDNWDASQAFVKAIEDDALAVISSFLTALVHDKQLFSVVQMPQTAQFLTNEEQAFIKELFPFTSFLQSDLLDATQLETIKNDPDNWIIKPTDGFGSHVVYPGLGLSVNEWSSIIDNHLDGASGAPYLVQRFCHPYTTPAIAFYDKEEDYTKEPLLYKNMEGLFLFDGKFSGIFTRLGPGPIILGAKGGITEANIYVDADDLLKELGWIN